MSTTFPEQIITAAIEQIVEIEFTENRSARPDEIVKIAVRIAPHAEGFSAFLIDELEAANEQAEWWDNVGKAEMKDERY